MQGKQALAEKGVTFVVDDDTLHAMTELLIRHCRERWPPDRMHEHWEAFPAEEFVSALFLWGTRAELRADDMTWWAWAGILASWPFGREVIRLHDMSALFQRLLDVHEGASERAPYCWPAVGTTALCTASFFPLPEVQILGSLLPVSRVPVWSL